MKQKTMLVIMCVGVIIAGFGGYYGLVVMINNNHVGIIYTNANEVYRIEGKGCDAFSDNGTVTTFYIFSTAEQSYYKGRMLWLDHNATWACVPASSYSHLKELELFR